MAFLASFETETPLGVSRLPVRIPVNTLAEAALICIALGSRSGFRDMVIDGEETPPKKIPHAKNGDNNSE